MTGEYSIVTTAGCAALPMAARAHRALLAIGLSVVLTGAAIPEGHANSADDPKLHTDRLTEAEQPAAKTPAATHPSHSARLNLITHNRIWIDAGANEIWPFILDTSAWKQAAVATAYSGQANRVGEIMQVVGESQGQEYRFFTEVVAIEPQQHKVIKIYPADRSFLGFSAWRLFDFNGGTLVTYDVYNENPAPGMSPDQIQAVEQQYTQLNGERFAREFEQLKTLVEQARSNF